MIISAKNVEEYIQKVPEERRDLLSWFKGEYAKKVQIQIRYGEELY